MVCVRCSRRRAVVRRFDWSKKPEKHRMNLGFDKEGAKETVDERHVSETVENGGICDVMLSLLTLLIDRHYNWWMESVEDSKAAGAEQNLTNRCRKILEVSKAFLFPDEVLIIVDFVRKGKEALLVFRQGREDWQEWSRWRFTDGVELEVISKFFKYF